MKQRITLYETTNADRHKGGNTTGRECALAQPVIFNLNRIQPKPMLAVTRPISILDKHRRLVNRTNSSVADILDKFRSFEQAKNELRIACGVELADREPRGFEDHRASLNGRISPGFRSILFTSSRCISSSRIISRAYSSR